MAVSGLDGPDRLYRDDWVINPSHLRERLQMIEPKRWGLDGCVGVIFTVIVSIAAFNGCSLSHSNSDKIDTINRSLDRLELKLKVFGEEKENLRLKLRTMEVRLERIDLKPGKEGR